MTASASTILLDQWLNRLVSLSSILAIATGLTLAKAITMAIDLTGELPNKWPALSSTSSPVPPASDLPVLDNRNFIPWPSALPEPAAGPESAGEPIFGDGDQDQPMFDATNLTAGENLALQQLAARREALDEREKILDMRAELNSRTETRLDQQIDRLAELKAELETLVKDLDENEESKLARLVKIYETMKPKAAAEIFNRLETPILLHVIERMKEVKSAAVLGKMDPAVAKRVTTELARKKERPRLNSLAVEGEV